MNVLKAEGNEFKGKRQVSFISVNIKEFPGARSQRYISVRKYLNVRNFQGKLNCIAGRILKVGFFLRERFNSTFSAILQIKFYY